MSVLTATTSARSSLWLAGDDPEPREPLVGEVQADVAVIRGGIARVTTAPRLQQAGVRTVLVEAATIGSGVTGNASAKVSALQAPHIARSEPATAARPPKPTRRPARRRSATWPGS